jgi:DNA modification methylase
MECKLYEGDCLEVMDTIDDHSVDLVVCDLPYGVTDAVWDTPIDLERLWSQYHRVVKKDGTVILFSIPPFNADLITSNRVEFSHSLYWLKNAPTGHLNSKKQPLRNVEEIQIFRVNSSSRDNSGMFAALREYFFTELRRSGMTRREVDDLLNTYMSSHYFSNGQQFSIPTEESYKRLQSTGYWRKPYSEVKQEYDAERALKRPPTSCSFTYNPQGLERLDKPVVRTHNRSALYGGCDREHVKTHTGYPRQLLQFDCEGGAHNTQKPVALLEYIIKTYSNENETVLDNTMGSGSTAVACKNVGRNFIGIELDHEYFLTARKRFEVGA